MSLVSLQLAKVHLRVGDDADADVQEKLDAAHELVLDYINQRLDPDTAEEWADTIAGWNAETVPKRVRSAILIQLTELYRFRGDDEEGPKRETGRLAPAVELLLSRLRDPALA